MPECARAGICTIGSKLLSILRTPHLLLVLTAFLWGGNAVAGKFAVGHVSPMMLTAGRWTIALVIIGVFAHHQIRQDWATIRKHWIYLLLMGGFGYSAFNFFLYSGLQYISAIHAALEQSAMPLVIFLLNYIIYRTGISWLQIAGFVLTLIGVVLVVSGGDPLALIQSGGEGISRGDWFMLAAALCYGGYSVALRSKPEMHWQSFLASLIAGAFIFALVGAALEHQSGQAQFPVTVQGLLVVIYAGIFPSLVSQGLFIKGVEALGANTAGLYINLVPVSAAILAVLLLGESLHLYHALAFVLVMGGIMIAQKKAQGPAQSRSDQRSKS